MIEEFKKRGLISIRKKSVATRLSKAADCSQQTCRLGSADLLSLVATSEKVSPGTRGVMSFNSQRRLHQPIELTPSLH